MNYLVQYISFLITTNVLKLLLQKIKVPVSGNAEYSYLYIYILKSEYLGRKLLFKQILLKTMERCFYIILNCNFSSLLLITT